MTDADHGGTVVAPDAARRRPTCWSTARRSPRSLAPGRALGGDLGVDGRPRHRRHRQVRRSPAASTCTPTWSCRSAARSPPTRSRPARAPRRGAAPPRSSTSPCSAPASACRTAWPRGTRKADGNCAIDYGFHQIIGGVDDDVARRRWTTSSTTRASPASSCSWPTRASSTRDDGQILRAMQTAREQRRDDHDARRERHRHRRARRAGARPRRDRPDVPRRSPARRARGRGHPPGDHAGQGRRQRAAVHRAHVGAARRSRRSPRPATRAANVFAETCPQYLYLTLEEQLGAARLRGRQVGLLDAAAHRSTSTTRTTCGRACARTTWRSCPPTTARSASRTRRSSASATSPRSRTASAASSTAWTCIYQGVVDGEITLERWVETCCHDAGADVRPVPAEGRHRARRPTPTSWSTTRTRTTDASASTTRTT